MRFHARLDNESSIEITCDGVLKSEGEFVAFYNEVPKVHTIMRSRLFGAPVADTITSNERMWLMVVPLRSIRFVCPAHILTDAQRASGTLTEGGDVEQAPGDSLSGPTEGDAQEGVSGND